MKIWVLRFDEEMEWAQEFEGEVKMFATEQGMKDYIHNTVVPIVIDYLKSFGGWYDPSDWDCETWEEYADGFGVEVPGLWSGKEEEVN